MQANPSLLNLLGDYDMAFDGNNYMMTSFKKELMFGAHDFDTSTGDTFKLALYTSSADGTDFGGSTTDMDETITAYNATNEVGNSGSYSAGGGTLNTVDPTTSGTTALVDFDDLTFTTATITARGAVVYNSTPNTTSIALTNPAILVLDFTEDKTSTAGDFTITFPTADASNAIIRIA
jgi:hypothetical protein